MCQGFGGEAVHQVVRERVLAADPGQLWALVSEPEGLTRWFAFAERIEVLEGEGQGRRQRLHGRWGTRRSEVDQTVTAFEPSRVIEWVHDEERLDGKPAPKFAAETRFAIRLEQVDGGTKVTLDSRQVPAAGWKGLVMRMFGTREVAKLIDQSLARLEEALSR